MTTLSRRRFLSGAATVLTISAAPGVLASPPKTLRIGWTAWSDAEAVTHMAKQLIEAKLATKVELVMTDIALQYAGLQRGQIDLMLMAWLPNTHKGYWDKVQGDVEDLGALYTDAKLGWAVPDYIPKSVLNSLDDLKKPDVKDKLKGQIQGIDAGSGLMRSSEQALKAYGLDYRLLTASDAAMVSALDRAMRKNEWIVVTTWSPHWLFSQYKIRYLEEPQKVLGGAEEIHALARKGFTADFPKVAAFIRNFKIPLSDLEGVMFKARSSSYDKEAAAYIASHPQLVSKWLSAAL
ncbi:glycine betaine ABC transporter substrate-binding protein [Aquabacterium sp.]|uniref:glycine betaine ABC transporter substrate-binding protein n=1 Tax=Aquabacterium sp. TaxID=1872578 RepID=UPI0035C76610